jgi:serine/threonine protein kinase
MPTETKSARTIFLDALERPQTADRDRFIDSACGADESLRAEVLRLLGAHGDLNDFMDRPAAGFSPMMGCSASEQVGTAIGRYKLLEQIGEGGMGVVFVAEQTEPVRRRVALKIIKPGMDTRQVIARFEAERQALAMMDHPNIAKVLDGGTTEEGRRDWGVGSREPVTDRQPPVSSLQSSGASLQLPASSPQPRASHTEPPVSSRQAPSSGRPYFVMELVRGMPITEYCDEAQVDIRGRLDLFMTVCHAVQHAHQKGIIHRDIKPSNVLVTMHDGKPVVKVIDFGVAKAVGQSLTERTIYTAFTELIGTPLYMSPEQAELSGLDVDTRSDVYSLGVLLYELLTGHTPFDRDTLVKVGLDEIRRMIREEEPPRPSHRISTLKADAGSTLGQRRGIDQRQLSRTLHGELDWIVMKALEKDRNRRYESASAFAADIERYLNNEPVHAARPSAMYRFRKFARKRRAAFITTAVVAMALITGTGISAWQAVEANYARHRAEANLRRGNDAVEALLVRVSEEKLLDEPHLEDLRKSLLTEALRLNSSFLDENPGSPEAKFEAAKAYRRMADIRIHLGEPQHAAAAGREAVRMLESLLVAFPDERHYRGELAKSYRALSISLVSGAATLDTEAILRKNMSLQDEILGASPDDAELLFASAHAHGLLGAAQRFMDVAESYVEFGRVIKIVERLRNRYPDRLKYSECIARTHWQLGLNSHQEGQYAKAKEELLLALSGVIELLTKSPRTSEFRKTHVEVLNSLAELYLDLSELEAALEYGQQAESAAEKLVADYPSNRVYRWQLLSRARACFAQIHLNRGDHAAAVKEIHELLSLGPETWQPYWLAATQLVKCIELIEEDGNQSEAERGTARQQYLEQARAYVSLGTMRGANDPQALNAFAWYLATCNVAETRDPRQALQLAEKAVSIESGNSLFWNTLGVSRYRAGQWRSAIEALQKSMALAKGKAEAFDSFFLAMAHWQLGNRQDGLKWYERAVAWTDEHEPKNAQLSQFRAEAAHLLGISAETNH